MPKPSAVMRIANAMAREIIAEQTRARGMLHLDAATVACNQVFHMGPGRAGAFLTAYNEALEELAGLYVSDCDENRDKRIEYAKGKRDELIRGIVGEELFEPFDLAYGDAYFDELHRIRVMQGKEAR